MQSAGVSYREEDFSTYIESASEAIVGIIGPARKGPTEPTLITTKAQFLKVYGNPVEGDYSGLAALRFLEKANRVWFKRVIHGGLKATAGVVGVDKLTFESITKDSECNGLTIDIATSGSEYTLTLKKGAIALESYTFNMTSTSPDYVTKVINGTSNTIKVIVNTSGEITPKQFTMEGGKDGGAYATAGEALTDKLVFRSKSFDSTVNGGEIYVSKLDPRTGSFDITLTIDGKAIEVITSVSLDPKNDRYVENFINTYSSVLNVQVTNSEALPYGSRLILQGGVDGSQEVDETDIVGIDGLGAFSNSEVTDINLLITPGWTSTEVVQNGIEICETRGDCLYIIDTPYGLTPQQAVDWTNGTGIFSGGTAIDSSYCAVYWSWVQIYDEFSRKKLWVPPSVVVAPQFAASDSMSEQWVAPAGLNRGKISNVLAVEYACTKGERDYMYGGRNIVNPLVNFRGTGIVIWGQKTGQRKPSSLDRVNVRRLMNYIKRIVSTATAYYVFEPNDSFTWSRWVDMVEPKLESIKQSNGIYDYVITMDSSTVTMDDMDNYTMPGSIKFKPTRSAEDIPLVFSIQPNSVEFGE